MMPWRWLGLSLALVVIFVVLQAPAWLVQQRALAVLPGLSWFSAEGTVWSGRGQSLHYHFGDRQLVFDQLQWRLHALAVLGGRLSLDIEGRGPGQSLTGELSRGITDTWRLRQGMLVLPVSVIAGPNSLLYGQLNLVIETLEIDAERITRLSGRGVWHGARWQAPGYIVALGDLDISLDDDGQGAALVSLRNRDPSDRIAVDLRLDLQGNYQLQAELAPAPDSRAGWAQWLPLVARAQGDGRYTVSNQGVLW